MDSSVYSRGCSGLLLDMFKSNLIYISILAFAMGISEASVHFQALSKRILAWYTYLCNSQCISLVVKYGRGQNILFGG